MGSHVDIQADQRRFVSNFSHTYSDVLANAKVAQSFVF